MDIFLSVNTAMLVTLCIPKVGGSLYVARFVDWCLQCVEEKCMATTQWPLVSRASGINRSKMDSHVCSLDETLLPSLSFCYQIGYCPSHRMVILFFKEW